MQSTRTALLLAVLLFFFALGQAQKVEQPALEPPTAPPSPDTCSTPDAPDFTKLATREPTEDEKKALVLEIMSRVAEARERVAAANANPRPFWEAFCAKHGLGILVNNTQRYNIFKANVARAVKQNANLTAEKDDTMAYGITQFSHLTQAEFIAIHLDSSMGNLKPQPLSSAESSTSGARKLMQGSMSCDRVRVLPDDPETLPSRLDWRDAGIITPVRDQGGCGSCSAFATIATLESTFIRKWYSRGYRSYNTDLSEDDWLECASGNQCRGAWPDSVFDYYGCQGTAFESSQPYNAHDGNTCRVISRYNPGSRTFGYVGRNTASLARAVYRNPTVIAVDARNWFGLAAGVVRRCNEPFTSLTHAVTVVGWIDGVRKSNGNLMDYWYVRNSWGTDFVDAGYIWLRKDCGGNGTYGMYYTNPWSPNYPAS